MRTRSALNGAIPLPRHPSARRVQCGRRGVRAASRKRKASTAVPRGHVAAMSEGIGRVSHSAFCSVCGRQCPSTSQRQGPSAVIARPALVDTGRVRRDPRNASLGSAALPTRPSGRTVRTGRDSAELNRSALHTLHGSPWGVTTMHAPNRAGKTRRLDAPSGARGNITTLTVESAPPHCAADCLSSERSTPVCPAAEVGWREGPGGMPRGRKGR